MWAYVYLKRIFPVAGLLVATTLGVQDYHTHHIAPQKFENACNALGINNPEAAINLLYLSGTLTPKTTWQNAKRAEIAQRETAWSHMLDIMQNELTNGRYDAAANKFFGSNLSWLDCLLGKEELISSRDSLKFLIAQTQELFGRKKGQERTDVFGQPRSDAEIEKEILSALQNLGLIDEIKPKGDEEVIIIPGASMIGLIARIAYAEFLTNIGEIHPRTKVITAGDRDLTVGLDPLSPDKVKMVRMALPTAENFSSIRNILLSPDKPGETKESKFASIVQSISDVMLKQTNIEIIKGVSNWSSFNTLTETGGTYFLIVDLGVDEAKYTITHTPKYPDGKRPDTASTAATFAKYYFDELYKAAGPNTIGIASNQPYALRQNSDYSKAIEKEARDRGIDPKNIKISVFAFKYDHGDAKGPMSELAAFVASQASEYFLKQELKSVMFSSRDEVSTDDMPEVAEKVIF